MPYLSGPGSTNGSQPCTSAAPFSDWHKVHGQAVHEWGFPAEMPWWEVLAYGWQHWGQHWGKPPSTALFVPHPGIDYGTPVQR